MNTMDDKVPNSTEPTPENTEGDIKSVSGSSGDAEPQPMKTECSECGKDAKFYSIYEKEKVVFCSSECHTKRNERAASPNLVLAKIEVEDGGEERKTNKKRSTTENADDPDVEQAADELEDALDEANIFEACHGGLTNNTILHKLLEGGADANQKDANDQPLIVYAAGNGDVTTLNLLLEKGADINQRGKGQATPLMAAADLGFDGKVSFLLSKDADTSLKDEEGKTALHRLERNRNIKCAELLVDKNPELLHAVDNFQQTVLHQAAGEGNNKLLEFLLDKNADLAALDNLNRSALHWAVIQGMETVVASLVERNCEKVINEPDRFGVRPIHYAIQSNRSDITEMLINKGCELEAGEARGLTALIYAASCGKRDMLELILPRCKNVNVTDSQGWTALHHASKRGDDSVCQLLLDHQAKADIVDNKQSQSALVVAVLNNQAGVAKIIIGRSRESCTVKDAKGRLALHYAAEMGKLEILNALVEQDNDDREKQENGNTAQSNDYINSADNSGHTALYLSAQNRQRPCCEHLLQCGAEVDELSRDLLYDLGLIEPDPEPEPEPEVEEKEEEKEEERGTPSPRQRYGVEETDASSENIEDLDLGGLADVEAVALNSRYIYEGHGPPPKNNSPRRSNSKLNTIPKQSHSVDDEGCESFHVQWKKLLDNKRKVERGGKGRTGTGYLRSSYMKQVKFDNTRLLGNRLNRSGQRSAVTVDVASIKHEKVNGQSASKIQNGAKFKNSVGFSNGAQDLTVPMDVRAQSSHSGTKRYSYSVVTT